MESNEVLVPVLVLDQKRLRELRQMDPSTFVREAQAKDSRLFEDVAVSGLSAKDFRIFEDGKQQVIEHLTSDFISAFDGKSAAGAEPPAPSAPTGTSHNVLIYLPNWPGYVIAYTPPPSPDGGCHKVTVTVDRPDALVYARPEYCDVKHAVNDELDGTRFGNQLEADLTSEKRGNLGVSVIVFPAFGGIGKSYRTDVIVESATKPKWVPCKKRPMIGVLGIVYTSNDMIAARFSGLISDNLSSSGRSLPLLAPGSTKTCAEFGPSVFGTMVNLPAGQYVLRAVLRDGKEFGRAEIPIALHEYNKKELAISNIVLAKRYRQSIWRADSDAAPHGQYEPLVTKGFEVFPTLNTRFKKGGPFYFYVEVHEPEDSRAPPHEQVEVHLRIVDARTGQVVKNLQPADAAPYAKAGDPVIPIGGGIDISALPRGSYQLQAQATDSGGDITSWRSASFTIVR